VRRALAKEPDQRFPNCTRFAAALAAALRGQGGDDPLASTSHFPPPAVPAGWQNEVPEAPDAAEVADGAPRRAGRRRRRRDGEHRRPAGVVRWAAPCCRTRRRGGRTVAPRPKPVPGAGRRVGPVARLGGADRDARPAAGGRLEGQTAERAAAARRRRRRGRRPGPAGRLDRLGAAGADAAPAADAGSREADGRAAHHPTDPGPRKDNNNSPPDVRPPLDKPPPEPAEAGASRLGPCSRPGRSLLAGRCPSVGRRLFWRSVAKFGRPHPGRGGAGPGPRRQSKANWPGTGR